ncbi:MAG: hypothetical protein ACI8XB_002444 [Patiriisocius sp.]|jgi:uncharacterized protein (TIGR01777 family)
MAEKVLITGGSGMVGRRLSAMLTEHGYEVSILTRATSANIPYKQYIWDISKNEIDPEAILNCNYIVHLAGAGITDKRWTTTRKGIILDSRIKSAELLLENVKKYNPNLKAFISSSGTGYYGAITSEKIYEETDANGPDFAAQVCVEWEKSTFAFQKFNIRSVALRTAIVICNEGGVTQRLKPIFNLGLGSALGSGNQYFPWIHTEDLCSMYLHVIKNENTSGAYNAAASDHKNNKEFSEAYAKSLNKGFWAPNVPAFILKIALGEMSEILLNGSRVSNKKILETGFEFKFSELEKALS